MTESRKISVDCPSCADKMERAVAKLDFIKSVSISFITQKMVFEYDGTDIDSALDKITKVCKRVDSDFKLL